MFAIPPMLALAICWLTYVSVAYPVRSTFPPPLPDNKLVVSVSWLISVGTVGINPSTSVFV